MSKFIILFLFLILLGIVPVINWQTLRQERSLKLWATYSVLYLSGGLFCLLFFLGFPMPNLFQHLTLALIPISRWLMWQ